MRVCHLWNNFFPIELGGLERYILNLSDFLSQQNSNISFLLLTDKSDVSLSKRFILPKCQRINSLEVHRLGPSLSGFIKNESCTLLHRKSNFLDYLWVNSLYREAAGIPEIRNVDVFHVHGLWNSSFLDIGVRLSQLFRKPLVVSLHGDSIDSADDFAMPLRNPVIVNLLRNADAITTFSNQTLKLLQELGLSKCCFVPNFIRSKSFARPLSSNDDGFGNRVVMVSRLDIAKNPITSVLAFSKVVKEEPQATLQIVGYGPLYEYVNSLIRKLNLEDSVKLVGMQKDVRKFLWNNDIFLGTRGSYIATLEAWASGLAVVAPAFGIMNEIIINEENGLLVRPNDVEQLASSIIKLIKSPSLRKTLAVKGQANSRTHDISIIAPRIADIYYSLQSKEDRFTCSG